jgi:superfamily II DNA or RNA helicase
MTPYKHQADEVAEYAHHPRRALFWSPRIGKTFGSMLSLQAGVPRLRHGIVVSPYGVCGQWARLLEGAGYHVVRLYDVPSANAISVLSDANDTGKATIAVVNYQRLPASVLSKNTLGDVLLSWGADALIIDESHYIVSASGHWAKAVRNLAWNIPWVRCLTGTPVPNHYGNLWGQLAALNPDAFGWHYKHFADRWLILDNLFRSRVLGYRNLDEELIPLIKQYCGFVRRDDVFGPDQWLVNTRELELPVKAARLYAKLAREWLIDDESEALKVDGSHILTRLIRLQQIASGFIQDDLTGEIRQIHSAKLDAVEVDLGEIIATGEKAIVFHRFLWEGEELVKRLQGKVRVLVVRGDTSSDDRDAMQHAINNDPGPIVAVVQTQSGGIGVDYSSAAYALFMSQSFSFVQEEQAKVRIYEQRNGVVIPKHLMYYRAMGTVDEFIAERIDLKQESHDNLTQINRHDMAFGSHANKRIRPKQKLDIIPELAVD